MVNGAGYSKDGNGYQFNGNGHNGNGHGMEIYESEFQPELFKPGFFEVYAGAMRTKKSTHLFEKLADLRRANIPALLFKPEIDRRSGKGKTMARNKSTRQCIELPTAHPEAIFGHLASYAKENGRPVKVVAIEEGQFFGYDRDREEYRRLPDGTHPVVNVVQTLTERLGVYCLMSMLDKDFAGRTFGPSGDLLVAARGRHWTWGNCMYRSSPSAARCGKMATRTQRLLQSMDDERLPGYSLTKYGVYVPAPYDDRVIEVEEKGKKEDDPPRSVYELRCRKHHIVPGKPEYFDGELECLIETLAALKAA